MENKIELVCPECNEKFNVDIFTSINVQMDKDMKNRVLSGKLFDMECAHCHSKFHIPYPVLYHDMEKKLLIQFTEEKEPSVLWIALLVLAIINMIVFGLIAGLIMIVSFFVTLIDFTDGIGLFIVSGGYFAASVYAIKFCLKKNNKK